MAMKNPLLPFAIVCAACMCAAADVVGVVSPDGKITAALRLENGAVVADVKSDGGNVAVMVFAGPVFKGALSGGFVLEKSRALSRDGVWKPVWGDRAEVRDAWNGTVLSLREKGGAKRAVELEFRAYDEGVAARYLLKGAGSWEIVDEKTSVTFPDGALAWAIAHTEATVREKPVAVKDIDRRSMLPLTVELPGGGVCTLLEAYCVDYPRSKADPDGKGGVSMALLGNDARGSGEFSLPWRALVIASDPGGLIHNSVLVQNLNPPCAISDTSWIKPGLTVSNERNCPIVMKRLTEVARLASTAGFRYVQIDWGWYGTEWKWSDEEREKWAKGRPDLAGDPDWRRNTSGSLWKCASGLVPYMPNWKTNETYVDLDVPRLVSYLRSLGMGLCLYVNDRSLQEEKDLDALFAHYARWGLAGLKPGFVSYGKARDTAWIRRIVETAAKHRLWLSIHDAHVPDGMDRTYPNLFLCEGGGGEEGRHPVRQDVTLPFTRCIAGPFDFTPLLFRKGVSHAHMVAFMLVYPGPSAVIRGSTVRHFSKKGDDAFGPELDFVKALPMTYDESRVLAAAIGSHVAIARRKGADWFVAGMTGAQARTVKLDFGFLEAGRKYALRIFTDDASDGSQSRSSLERRRTVSAGDSMDVPMCAAGGFAALLQPLPQGSGG